MTTFGMLFINSLIYGNRQICYSQSINNLSTIYSQSIHFGTSELRNFCDRGDDRGDGGDDR